MRTRLVTEPDGCWTLWEPSPGGWRVAAEGRNVLWLAAARVWWWAAISP